jgi:hypothetical protein
MLKKKKLILKVIAVVILTIVLCFGYVVYNINTHTYSDPSTPIVSDREVIY